MKFGNGNCGMHRIGRRGEWRARGSLTRGSIETPQQWQPGGLSNNTSHTGSLDLITAAQTIKPTIFSF